MNATFETIRKELKKYNAEENEVPPKLVLAGSEELLDIENRRKQNSQFIISVREFSTSEKHLIERLLEDARQLTGRTPLAFFYDNKESIKTVIEDFQDYYNIDLGPGLFPPREAHNKNSSQFCLILIIFESTYYK